LHFIRKAPEGRDIGNHNHSLPFFQPQRGVILVIFHHKQPILRPAGAEKKRVVADYQYSAPLVRFQYNGGLY
jgi:hypothetical protein